MADQRQLVSGYAGRRVAWGRPVICGRVFEQRLYGCNKCGHRNIVARWVEVGTGRVQAAKAWRGRCGSCGAYLGWQDRGR